MTRPVVITGIGIGSSIGCGQSDFWSNCLQDATNVAAVPEAWTRPGPLKSKIWSPLPTTTWGESNLNRIELKQLDPVSVLGLNAAREAFEDAGIRLTPSDPKRNSYRLEDLDSEQIGVFVGTGIGGIQTVGESHAHQFCTVQATHIEELSDQLDADAQQSDVLERMRGGLHYPKRFNPFNVSMLMPNACAASIAVKFGLQGPNRTLALACASGTAAIGQGYQAVASGQIEMAIVGGAEYLYDAYGTIFRSFDAPRTLVSDYEDPATANRPFDENRSGFLFSQGGAAMLVIESAESAKARRAQPVCEIAGYGETCDAHSMMVIEPEGTQIKRMLRRLLTSAAVDARDIDYINAHGTGTTANDAVESRVIGELFRDDVLVNSTKALIGHTIGAAGAIEAVVTALSLRDQQTHGSPNLEKPIADLNFVRAAGKFPLRTALSQSFGFGGHNTALLLKN